MSGAQLGLRWPLGGPGARRALAAGLILLGARFAGAEDAAPAASAEPGVEVRRTSGATLETAALLLSDREGGPLPVAVAVYGLAGPTRVAVVVEVQGSAVMQLPQPMPARPVKLDFAVYVIAADGSVAASAFESLEVSSPAALSALAGGGLRHLVTLDAPAGDYTVHALVRQADHADRVALRRVGVHVPAAGEPALAAVFRAGAASWVEAEPERAESLPWRRPPAARTVLELGEPAELEAFGGGTAASSVAAGSEPIASAAELAVELRDAGGAVTVLAWSPRGGDGGGTFVPRGLAAGEYELRLRRGASLSPPVSVVLVDADPGGRAWVAFGAAGAPQGEAPAAASAPARDRRLRSSELAQLKSGVAEARASAAAGHAADAARALAGAASPILFGAEPLAPAVLARPVAELLLPPHSDGRELAPLLDLALALVEAQTPGRPRTPVLVAFGAALVQELAARADERQVPQAERALAAQALLVVVPVIGDRAAALRSALALGGDEPSVLASVATDQMARGDFAAAEPLLDRWLRLEPGSVEARVRLGRLLLETGHAARGEALLREAGASQAPDSAWLSAVAYQELARRALSERETVAAERLVRQGLERFPADEKLLLLLAAVLTARGQGDGAVAALARIQMTAGPQAGALSDGPRFRFGRLAGERLAAARAAVATGAQSSRSALHAPAGGGQ